jgi:hypothetical protein
MLYPNLFQHHTKIGGKAWLRHIPLEDRQAFAIIGLMALGRWQFAHLGGKARAQSARRDARGRFLKTQS